MYVQSKCKESIEKYLDARLPWKAQTSLLRDQCVKEIVEKLDFKPAKYVEVVQMRNKVGQLLVILIFYWCFWIDSPWCFWIDVSL